jgi:hypothetical protein
MMVGAVLPRVPWAAIPVPDIGRMPPLWSPPPLSLVGGGLAILAVLAFVLVVFSAARFFERGISPWRLMIVTGVVFAIGFAVAYTSNTRSKDENNKEWRQYNVAEHAAREDAAAKLGAAYGLTIDDPAYIPVDRDESAKVDVVFADGSKAECLVGSYGGVYEVRCGGTSWITATPVPLVDGGR